MSGNLTPYYNRPDSESCEEIMIHGKTYSYNTGGNFLKKTKNVKDKKSYILTDPSPKTIQPRFPILADHFSKNIQRSERGIEDLYLAKKPTCLKVKSLKKRFC